MKPVTQQTRAELLIEEALKTSEIEGEQLDPRAVRSSSGPMRVVSGPIGTGSVICLAWQSLPLTLSIPLAAV